MNKNFNVSNKYFFIFFSLLCASIGQLTLLREKFFIAVSLFLISIFIFIFITRDYKATGLSIKRPIILDYPGKKRKLTILSGVTITLTILSIIFFVYLKINSIAWLFHFLSIFFLAWFILAYEGRKNLFKTVENKIKEILKIPLLLVIIIGILPRIVQLDQIPFGLWFDEADFGINAIKILEEDGFAPVFIEYINHVPAYYIYLLAISIKFFGPTIFALRIVSVIFGILTIIVGYFCAKEMFNSRIALVFSFFIAVSRWNINWSRIGLDNITIPFFELLIIYLLYLGISKKGYFYFTLAGISMGLGLSLYAAMRIFPLVICIWILSVSFFNKEFISSFWKEGLVFAIAILITIVPIGQYAISNPDIFWHRVNQTSIFRGKTNLEAWQAIGKTTKEHLLMFNYKGDRNGRHNLSGQPILDNITAPLMVVGLGIALSRSRYPKFILIITWWLLMLVPGIFSLDFESPQSLRAIGSMPAAYLLAIIPINDIFRYEIFIQNKTYKVFINLFVIFSMVLIGIFNINTYFNKQMKSSKSWQEFSTRETIIARRMNELGNNAKYLVSTFFYNTPTINYLAPNVTTISRFETYDLFPLDQLDEKTTVLFLDGGRKALFGLAQKYFPQGEFTIIKDPNGLDVLYEVILEPIKYAEYQGLMATYYTQEKDDLFIKKTIIEENFSFSWIERDIHGISRVEWKGVVYAPLFGEYGFYFFGSDPIKIIIDGDEIEINKSEDENKTVTLSKGNHEILIITDSFDSKFDLRWKQPDQPLKIIKPSFLYHNLFFSKGLISRYYSTLNWTGEIIYSQVDPQIDFYFHKQPVPRPYSAEWVGFITIPESGEYTFSIRSRDQSILLIDGNLLLENQGIGEFADIKVNLKQGKYPINVRFIDQTSYTLISLYWAPPGSELSIIPPEYLSIK